MRKILDIAKWTLTLGSGSQNFLGARWIEPFLRKVSESKKRIWALRILSLSPHYFFDADNPKYAEMNSTEYLEQMYRESVKTRRDIFENLIKPHVEPTDNVMEYGCGPGFLAKETAGYAAKVFGCDISGGVLACAEILNHAPNLTYVLADDKGLEKIENESLDAIYSVAVIQHLSNEIFEIVLKNCEAKLRKGGKLILHIQLTDDVWKPEEEWKSDTSIRGKMKLKYGLHCFGRTDQEHKDIIENFNFRVVSITPLPVVAGDKVSAQALLIAEKQ